MRLTRNQTAVLAVIAVVLIIAVWCVAVLPHTGKTKVKLEAIPANANITMNGKKIDAGTKYLDPGTYTFITSADGYDSDTQIVMVADKDLVVGLLPDPQSDAAKQATYDNVAVQSRREALGGINAEREGLQSRADNPIMSKLPYIDPESLYSIDYGYTDDQPSHFFIVINNSSPEGRVNAIRWLKKENVNISTNDIRYEDYSNPLLL